MTAAHLHLALNHIPVLGTLFATALLAYGLWHDHTGFQKGALGLLAAVGTVAVAVYLTGEPAEALVEGLAGVSHEALEAHEAWGWYAALTSIGTGVLSLGALLYRWAASSLPRWIVRGVFLLALAGSALLVYAATLGGKVHHPELRAGPTAVETTDGPGADMVEE
ncbi:hypothetical protein [Salinibacter grassmerensis]|uniref:hypothetical protein n=1 Tax=Salinibacter grassmerensis TaxID=3040353 RepID=UPI0021E7F2ED|nr:hypothetical protein [Salinibacter grassmerensis]